MALPKISVPVYDIVLPSTGKTLKMRPYLVKEEKVLMIALESSDPGQIADAVRSVIKECYSLDATKRKVCRRRDGATDQMREV
jgi:hypothetical protein